MELRFSGLNVESVLKGLLCRCCVFWVVGLHVTVVTLSSLPLLLPPLPPSSSLAPPLLPGDGVGAVATASKSATELATGKKAKVPMVTAGGGAGGKPARTQRSALARQVCIGALIYIGFGVDDGCRLRVVLCTGFRVTAKTSVGGTLAAP